MKIRYGLFSFCSVLTFTYAATWQFEGAAVKDLGRLDRQALFDLWLPIQLKEGTTPQSVGTYVSYQHEGLLYYFGPFLNKERALAARKDLEDLRVQLVSLDPKFESSTISTPTAN